MSAEQIRKHINILKESFAVDEARAVKKANKPTNTKTVGDPFDDQPLHVITHLECRGEIEDDEATITLNKLNQMHKLTKILEVPSTEQKLGKEKVTKLLKDLDKEVNSISRWFDAIFMTIDEFGIDRIKREIKTAGVFLAEYEEMAIAISPELAKARAAINQSFPDEDYDDDYDDDDL